MIISKIITLFLLCLTTFCQAQEKNKHDGFFLFPEIGANLSVSAKASDPEVNDIPNQSGGINLGVSPGYFLNEQLSLGAYLLFAGNDSPIPTSLSVGVQSRYFFDSSTNTPFLNASLGTGLGSTADRSVANGIKFAIGGGYEFSRDKTPVLINLTYNYQATNDQEFEDRIAGQRVVTDLDINSFALTIGVIAF